MKTSVKRKVISVPPQASPDIAGLINTMQQHLVFLEKKIDTLISRSSERPFEIKQFSKPVQSFVQPPRNDDPKQANGFRERTMHKAICADCNKECEVPFKPSGGRPVYCKECFSKRKAGSSFKEKRVDLPKETNIAKDRHFDKHKPVENVKPVEHRKPVGHRKPVEKKKTPPRRRK